MPDLKPFVSKTISALHENSLDSQVNETVNSLLEQGYSIKVIVHQPILEQIPAKDYSEVLFMTTILGTLTSKANISQP